MREACLGLWVITWLSAVPLSAAADPTADELGFGDAEEPAEPSPAALAEPSPWTASSSFRVRAAARVERLEEPMPAPLANLRAVVEPRLEFRRPFGGFDLHVRASLHAEADLPYLASGSSYDLATREEYGWQLWPGESFVAISALPLEVRIGTQVASFGQTDMLSVLDVINPRDLREPLLADLGESRLPLLMTRFRLALDRFGADLVVVHEPDFGLLPPPLGEWSPFRRLLLDNPLAGATLSARTVRNRAIPSRDPTDFSASQLVGRVSWGGGGVDVALLAGSVLDMIGVPLLPSATALRSQAFELPILHPRYAFVGHSGAWTFGAFVLRWEVVFELSRAVALQQRDVRLQLSAERHHQLRGVAGLLYAPSEQLQAALELSQSYLFDNPSRSFELQLKTLYPIEATQFALRFQHRFLRDRATVSLLLLRVGLERLNAWAARVDAGYQLLEGLDVSLGFVTYQPTREFGYFYGFDHHDRAFVQLRWEVSS